MKKLFSATICACLLASCSMPASSDVATTTYYEPETTLTVSTEMVSPETTTIKEVPVVTTKVVPPKTTPAPQETTPRTKMYTSSEVAQHSTASDCWLILSGGVYDVTSYIPRHPGGEKILRGCGRDATQMFSQHPASAKAMKEQFKIGDLAQ